MHTPNDISHVASADLGRKSPSVIK